LRIVAEHDRADAFVRRRDQDRAERAFAEREADRRAGAAFAEVCRRHAEQIVGRRIEAAVRIEAGAVDRLGDGVGAFQFVAHAFAAMRIGVSFRRDAGHGFEHAMKMPRALADHFGERLQRRQLLRLLDRAAGARDRFRLRILGAVEVRLAAQAGAKARRFRLNAGVA
jgi:hypothetical protein